MPEHAERPFTQISAIVTKFAKGKVSLDDAERSVLEIAKVAAPTGRDVVAKGMYQVSRAAELFDGISALEASCQWEAKAEGDASPVPAMFAECLKGFAAALKALLDEELSEALAEEDAEKAAKAATGAADRARAAGEASKRLAEVVKALGTKSAAAGASKGETVKTDAKPAEPSEVEKALAGIKADLEAKLSKAQADLAASQTALSESHQALSKALETREQIDKRAKDEDAQVDAVTAAVADLTKRYDEQIAKVNGETGELRKAADAALVEAKRANDVNEQLIAELARRPKGVLRAIPISKAADNGTEVEEDDVDRLQKAAIDPRSSEEARSAARRELVKLSHAHPLRTP